MQKTLRQKQNLLARAIEQVTRRIIPSRNPRGIFVPAATPTEFHYVVLWQTVLADFESQGEDREVHPRQNSYQHRLQ